ncbi:MAG TPA: FG-GAP-like repeat-containing protein [Pyrinomonadaceae bacterium]|nr:FG-GAP-like repeat-containing protein [Pyrinomonadaceae bacterium]
MKKIFGSQIPSPTRRWIYVLLLFVLVSGQALTPSAQTKKRHRQVFKKTSLVKKKTKKRARHARAKLIPPTPRDEDEFEGDPEKRSEWFMRERTFPSGSLPEEARRSAWLSRPIDARFTDPQTAPQWRSIGPQPTSSFFPNNWGLTSGRINAIAVSPSDPNLILVGAATGGIWRSTDGGASFASASDNHVDLAVGSIAFSPSNNSIVYAGMGDKSSGYLGTGVLKSTDGGQTWARISNSTLPAPGRISQILVDPVDANRVYVAQYGFLQGNTVFASGFFYSADGGVSWTKSLSGLPKDLVRHPTDPNIMFLGVQRFDLSGQPNTGGIWKSVDRGVTWNRIYTSPFAATSNIKIAVTPAAPESIYVVVGGGTAAQMEVSTNGGGIWTNKGSAFDTAQFSYNCYIFVHPSNPNIIYVGTRDLWVSTDGGTNYTNQTRNFSITGVYSPSQAQSHPDQHHFYISPTNPNVIYIANDGGLWKSTDGAGSFQSLNSTLSLTMFVSLDLHPTDPTRSYGGTQDNGTQRRNLTGGLGWREFATGDGGQTIVDPLDPSIIYVTYVGNTVYRYSNNGDSFGGTIGNNTIFSNDRVAFYPPFVGNDVDSTIYFGTYRLHMSTTRGASWTQPGGTFDLTFGASDVLSTIAVSRSNTNIIYTGSSQGRAMVSTNAGASWTDITAGLPTRFIKSIAISKTNPNTAYLTVSGFGSGHVFKTVNAGANWTDISGDLPNIPTNTILIDPRDPSTLYVGTDIGVFRSTAGGGTWETLNGGMPPTIVTELDAQPSGLIQAATYGRGMYELANTRRTWSDFDGDGRTDISIFRPTGAEWWYLRSSDNQHRAFQFGNSADKLVPGDFTGDGKSDIATWRASTGEWFIFRSEDSSFYAFPFGTNGDLPAPADYDGDGKTDAAVFRPSNSVWYISRSTGGSTIQQFGAAGDVPIAADYDGDLKADIAIFRPAGAEWWIQRSSAGLSAFQFGAPGDKAVYADYTGDGKADAAIWRPSNGNWYILRSEDTSYYAFPFGQAGDAPAPGDYDGDGKTDPAIFRPSTSTWFIQRTTAGTLIQGFGQLGDVAVPSSFVP